MEEAENGLSQSTAKKMLLLHTGKLKGNEIDRLVEIGMVEYTILYSVPDGNSVLHKFKGAPNYTNKGYHLLSEYVKGCK
jgi:hypothetical protein